MIHKTINNNIIVNSILLIILILVTIPRFNWGILFPPLDSFIGAKPFDVEQYELFVEHFRGNETASSKLEGPFMFRPMVPFLAAFLPFDALTSINLINLLLLCTAVIFVGKTAEYFYLSNKSRILTQLTFILSFPLFYYGTSGYIDPSLIALSTVLIYLMLTAKIVLFYLLFLIITAVKETVIVFIPVWILWVFSSQKPLNRKLILAVIPIIIFIISYTLIRLLAVNSSDYLWVPSLEIFQSNISRVKTFLSFLLTVGFPGLFLLIFILKYKKLSLRLYNFLWVGTILVFLVWIFSLFSAYSDGRQLWLSYVFTIPIMMLYLKRREEFNQ